MHNGKYNAIWQQAMHTNIISQLHSKSHKKIKKSLTLN